MQYNYIQNEILSSNRLNFIASSANFKFKSKSLAKP